MLKRYLSILTFGFLYLVTIPGYAGTLEQDGLFAEIHTNKGVITAKLFYQRAPMTVMNFIGLAEGTTKWKNPVTGKPNTKPLYQNLIFHNVREFMVQTGDPTGKGTGGPGFVFADEFHPELQHDKAGILSMANRGPNTNGSQFFITRKPTKWLNNHHSVFGEVIDGLDVVEKIVRGDKLERLAIIRVGGKAKAFDTGQAHHLAQVNMQAAQKAAERIIPEKIGPLDSAKVPKPDQPSTSPGDFEFIVIGHTEMRVHPPGKIFYQDHKSALAFATKLVRYARSKDVAFDALINKYSDMERDGRTRNVTDKGLPPPMKSIFRLKPGQVSEPYDSPTGIYIFHRLPTQK